MKMGLEEKLRGKIEDLLSEREKRAIRVTGAEVLGGGSINRVFVLSLDIGYKLLLKCNRGASGDFFLAEARGLKELRRQSYIEVPSVICSYSGDEGVPSFLLMDYISGGKRKASFYEDFGRFFGLMHKVRGKAYGFSEDNYIGLTPQVNAYTSDWVEFFRDRRLSYQISLARANGLWTREFDSLWFVLEKKLDDLISSSFPSLLHGDLWSGNYIVGVSGGACFIDPAVYYGNNEADLAMTELFGGFSSGFYEGYNEVIPLDRGYEDRKKVYNLYHLINHLNLFGSSYSSSVHSILSYFGS